MSTDWFWSGAPSTSGLTVVAGLTASATSVRAAFSTSASFTSPIYTPAVAPDSDNIVRCVATSLAADTRYYYALEIDGILDTTVTGRGRTHPASPETVRVAFGACSRNTLSSPAYQAIVDQDPTMFLHLGDFHYQDQVTNNQATHRGPIITQLKNASSSVLWHNVTVDRIWDDHDFTSLPHANCRGEGTYKAVAAAAFRQTFPHYTLPDANALYHDFAIGKVRFIVTDLRYFGDPNATADGPGKTLLGATQKQWFKDTCLAAKEAGELIIWASSSVWPITASSGNNSDLDHWNSFATERRELADYWRENDITDLAIISGDVHALAYMASADFSTNGGVDVPVLQSAALARETAPRTAAWDDYLDGDDHYAILEVTEVSDGGFHLHFEGHEVGASDEIVMAYSRGYGRAAPSLRVPASTGGGFAARGTGGWHGVYKRSAA